MDSRNNKCSYCLNKLSKHFIRCCTCEKLKLCINCFSCGVEGGSHKNSHEYEIDTKDDKDTISVYLDKDKWSVDEEIKLLNGIEVYGIGNWEDISNKVETRNGDECRQHYTQFYLAGSLGQCVLPRFSHTSLVKDHPSGRLLSPGISPSLFQTHQPPELTPEEQMLLGYMPKRDDFERDYDNDAESILCKLRPSFNSDDLEDALRVAHVSIYTHRLSERERRRGIAREHGLVPLMIADILNKKTTPGTTSPRFCRAPNPRSTAISTYNRPYLGTNGFHMNQSSRQPPPTAPSPWTASPPARSAPPLLAPMGDPPVHHTPLTSPPLLTKSPREPREKSYDPYHIPSKLKPFFRYLANAEGRQFLLNLDREEALRQEISDLCELRRKGYTTLEALKLVTPKSVNRRLFDGLRDDSATKSPSRPVAKPRRSIIPRFVSHKRRRNMKARRRLLAQSEVQPAHHKPRRCTSASS